jgi:hypothetical protein
MAEETASKREKHLTRLFEHESEPKVRGRAHLDVVAVIFQYEDQKQSRIDLASLFPQGLPPPCVGRAAAAFGVNTSAGNAGNTLDSKLAEDIRIAVENRLELFEMGKWSQERQGGGAGPKLLLDTLVEFRKAHNQPVDEASLQKFVDAFDDKDRVKVWMGDPEFLAIYVRLQTERRLARAQAKPTQASELLA